MKIIFLSLRGNIIGDSVREIALAKKYFHDYNLKNKIIYPCGSIIFELLRNNKYLEPVLIKKFNYLTKNISKYKKLFYLLKGFSYLLKLKDKYDFVIYLGNKYFIRKVFAKFYAKLCSAKYKKDCFENAKGYYPELFFTKKDENRIKKYLPKNNLKTIAINIESKDHERCWKIEKYFQLIKELTKKYNVILLGLDKKYNSVITSNINKNLINLVGKLNINESALIIKNSTLYLGNDSGLIHIAYSLKTPVITILSNIVSITYKKIFNKNTVVKLLKKPPILIVLKNVELMLNDK